MNNPPLQEERGFISMMADNTVHSITLSLGLPMPCSFLYTQYG